MILRRCGIKKTLILLAVVASLFSSAMAQLNLTDDSWYLDGRYRHAHSRITPVATYQLTHAHSVRRINWVEVNGCNTRVPTTSPIKRTDDVLPQSSSCPWNWVINHDPNRSPSTLLEAQCACRTCLYHGNQGQRCQPVHYFRPVTYFKGDSEREQRRLYRLAVGCTCERSSRR